MAARVFALRGWFCLVGALLAVQAVAQADDFHMESQVFAGKDPSPVSQTTTLFKSGIVYDYRPADKHVAVFDKPRNRFLLLDGKRRVKLEVTTSELQTFCDRLQEEADKGNNAYVRFLARPKFVAKFEESSGELTLDSPHMNYRVQTEKAHSDEACQQYREFSDWYARLNAKTSATPPFPRLALNEELFRRGLVATQVKLTVPQQAALGGKGLSLRSEHKISWRLLQPDDVDLISETANQLAAFKSVDTAEYARPGVAKR